MMLKLFVPLLFPALLFAASTPSLKDRQEQFEKLIEHLVDNEEPKEAKIQSYGLTYTVVVHNKQVRNSMKAKYSKEDLQKLDDLLSKSTTIKVNERGLVQAADRDLKAGEDPTN